MVQLQKRFTDRQIRELIERYLSKEIERDYSQQLLGIGKTRFFAIIIMRTAPRRLAAIGL